MKFNEDREDWKDRALLIFGFVCLVVGFAVVYGRQNTQIERLQWENHCLRHPELWTGATSSVTAVRGLDGKFHTTYGGRDLICQK